jgi:competence protein ComEC
MGYLSAQGVTSIDNLVISNPDADHAASCNELFHAYTVRHFYHQGSAKDTDTWRECLEAADAEPGLTIHTDVDLNPGDALSLSAHAAARLLSINANAGSINAGSIVFRVDFGQFSFILPGDIECAVEQQIIAGPLDLDVDVLQAGHHGSKTSTCTPWLEATSPEAVVIPVGTNSYGHPAPEVISRVAATGAKLYRTDLNGTVTFTSDGTTYSVSVQKSPAATPAPTTSPTSSPPPTGALEIAHIEYDPPGNDQGENLANEYVEIRNGAAESVSFSGYALKDAAGTTFTFPSSFVLPAGATVKVRTGTGTDTASDLYWGRGAAVWNNDHDTATLLASGTVVAEANHSPPHGSPAQRDGSTTLDGGGCRLRPGSHDAEHPASRHDFRRRWSRNGDVDGGSSGNPWDPRRNSTKGEAS